MAYLINEIFYTLQGEGTHAGRPAVFVRFSRCNLWTGREEDRAKAICQFCDTDFLKVNLRFDNPQQLVAAATAELPDNAWDIRAPMVVLTGGEPMLQVDRSLINALLEARLYVAIETNGTQPVPFYVDWLCVSPKAGTKFVVTQADEVKLVYPQLGYPPEQAEALVTADSYRLQPMDGPNLEANTKAAIDYVLANPRWSLSVQTHKVIGVR